MHISYKNCLLWQIKVTHPLPQLSTAALLIRDALRVCPAWREYFHLSCIGSYKAKEGSFDTLKQGGRVYRNFFFWKMDANGAFLAHFFRLQIAIEPKVTGNVTIYTRILILKVAVGTYINRDFDIKSTETTNDTGWGTTFDSHSWIRTLSLIVLVGFQRGVRPNPSANPLWLRVCVPWLYNSWIKITCRWKRQRLGFGDMVWVETLRERGGGG